MLLVPNTKKNDLQVNIFLIPGVVVTENIVIILGKINR